MLWVLSIGCAVKASLELIEAEQKYILAQQYKEQAPFEWYMADQYIKKARERQGAVFTCFSFNSHSKSHSKSHSNPI